MRPSKIPHHSPTRSQERNGSSQFEAPLSELAISPIRSPSRVPHETGSPPSAFRHGLGRSAAFLAVFLAVASLRADLVPTFSQTVFVGGGEGAGGTPRYRIPTLAMAPDGTFLAFAEGRQTQDDPGSGFPISMNCKSSSDHGRTWSPIQVLASNPAYAYSDPRVLVDHQHNQVFLFYTQWPVRKGEDDTKPGVGNDSSVLLYRASRDNGRTWGAPVNLNPALKKPDWYMLASIVGVGVQLHRQTAAEGGANGRLIFPAGFTDSDRQRHNISACQRRLRRDPADQFFVCPGKRGPPSPIWSSWPTAASC